MHSFMQKAAFCSFVLLALVAFRTESKAQATERKHDLAKEKVLYAIGYAHLDTQWRWDYKTTIDEYLPATMKQNFELFEKYPNYVFNFTGSIRHMMMKEYYPEDFKKVEEYVRQGRWHVVGSSVDEGDVNVPSAESLVRQILYGNNYFQETFNKRPVDFLIPDCFGFAASLPTIFNHCGLKGFVTQKLTWGSAIGIPFNVGVWKGPDGEGVVAVLNPGAYVHDLTHDLKTDSMWIDRIESLGKQSGVYTDYHFYGVGDRGGAPGPASVEWLEKSVKGEGAINVVATASDQLFLDLTEEQKSKLPTYTGDILLTEHSAGTLTSQAYVKRWNRKGELLADSAERISVAAMLNEGNEYPSEQIESAWLRILANQMHDILPGTSIPKAYEYSWNDLIIAQNLLAQVITRGVSALSTKVNTQFAGEAIVIFNPLAMARTDIVEIDVDGQSDRQYQIFGPDGKAVESQIVFSESGNARLAFVASAPAMGLASYELRRGELLSAKNSELSVSESGLENSRYKVSLASNGDIAQIFDKQEQRNMLSAPAQTIFLRDAPAHWPAWNMDWKDLKAAPVATLGAAAQIKVIEEGPVRVAVEVTREALGSKIVQTLSLAKGGDSLVIEGLVDWHSKGVCLKATFPLAVKNENATYNWETGTIERGTNDPKKYEVPSHKWIDLTDADGSYGVSILDDCKYGSDKPDDHSLRLTLLRTPECNSYHDQATQDHGMHEFVYAVAGHAKGWREGDSHGRAARLNQPLLAFKAAKSDAATSRQWSFMSVDSQQIAVRAVKKAEYGDRIIVRLQELHGQSGSTVLSVAAEVEEFKELDGQERPVAATSASQLLSSRKRSSLHLQFKPYQMRTIALKIKSSAKHPGKGEQLALDFNSDVLSVDNGGSEDGDFDGTGRSIPAEMLPSKLEIGNTHFNLGSGQAGEKNAISCRGQEIALPSGVDFDQVEILAAAVDDTQGVFKLGGTKHFKSVQAWTGFIGLWDNRVWQGEEVISIDPGFIKRDPVAWFCTHRHLANGKNDAYQFTYLYHYTFAATERDAAARTFTLPNNPKIKVFAITLSKGAKQSATALQPLYDTLEHPRPVSQPYVSSDEGSYGTGLFVDKAVIELASRTTGAKLYYSLDGSLPTLDSLPYVGGIEVTKDCTIRAIAFKDGMPNSRMLESSYKRAKPVPSIKVDSLRQGLNFRYYETEPLRRLPEFKELAPIKLGRAGNFDISGRDRDDNFAYSFSGYIKIDRAGPYLFGISSDDGSKLYLGGKLLIDHDGLHGASVKRGTICLEEGYYAIRAEMFERGGDETLEVSYRGPGIDEQLIPASALFAP